VRPRGESDDLLRNYEKTGSDGMEEILGKIANRYEAIRVMAKEARRINTLIRLSGEEIEDKPTTIAMRRLVQGKVKYEYDDQGEEQ
jgi:DNA-directed RNA polymerase omega subunit